MSSKYSDEKIKVTSYGYQRSQPQNLTVGERLEFCKSHIWKHNEGRKFYIFLPESGKKMSISLNYSISLIEFSFLIKVLLYQYLQEEIIGMV